VAEPWWQNDELKELLDQGLEPVIVEMTAYFPGVPSGLAIKTEKIFLLRGRCCCERNISELGIKTDRPC